MRLSVLHILILGLYVPITIALSGCESSTPFANLSARADRNISADHEKDTKGTAGAIDQNLPTSDISKLPEIEPPLTPQGLAPVTHTNKTKASKVRTQKTESDDVHTHAFSGQMLRTPQSVGARTTTSESGRLLNGHPFIQKGAMVPVLFINKGKNGWGYLFNNNGKITITGTENNGKAFHEPDAKEERIGFIAKSFDSSDSSELHFRLTSQARIPTMKYITGEYVTQSSTVEPFIAFDYNVNEKPTSEQKSNTGLESTQWSAFMLSAQYKEFRKPAPYAKLSFQKKDESTYVNLGDTIKWNIKNCQVYRANLSPTRRVLIGIIPSTPNRAAVWFVALPETLSSPSKNAS